MALQQKYDHIRKYVLEAVLAEPMHIGSASAGNEEILIHPVTRVPFIQATSIAGVFREYYEEVYGGAEALFGDQSAENGSRIVFSDGIFCGDKALLELRPRIRINGASGTVADVEMMDESGPSGQHFNMESIGAGAVFQFHVCLCTEGEGKAEDLRIMEILSALHAGAVQLGGQKSNGCGYVRLENIASRSYNMKAKEDRIAWSAANGNSTEGFRDRTGELDDGAAAGVAYTIIIDGKPENSLLVKSIGVRQEGERVPDAENICNAKGEYIVPGSTLKGVFRSRYEQIARLLAREGKVSAADSLIEAAFGKEPQGEDMGHPGIVYLRDAVVENATEVDANRIHVDKFTGGVINQGLFMERIIGGEHITLRIAIRERVMADQVCAIMLYAVRDLAAGIISVGSGYSVGRGFIDVDKITVTAASGKTAKINVEGRDISDPEGILGICQSALRKEA